jgi:small subunit ribosomal protein S30e
MGKVHGSLARAGKVKSQTPKVEPQEKKKKPKGRAYKRMVYTRRFVNVTMTGGKRKV